MDKYVLLLLTFGLLAIVMNSVAAGGQQSITLYESNDVNATNQTFTNNVRDLFANGTDNKLGNITKACVQSKGIWTYYTSANYSTKGSTIFDTLIYTNNTSPVCNNVTTGNITSIRHVGHSDLSKPAISLYTTNKMQGFELYFEGYKLILPTEVKINSFAFTGLKNYIISNKVPIGNETAEQLKEQKCLDVTRINKTKDNLAYNQTGTDLVSIKYIQRCCTGKETIVKPEGSDGLGINETAEIKEDANAMNGPGLILTVKLNSPPDNTTGNITMIGEKLSLTITMEITNYTFIGTSCYTIYEGIDFTGNVKCLVPGTKITDKNITEYTFGSVKIGCTNESRCSGSSNSGFMISSMQIMFSTFLAIFIMTIFK